MRKIAQTTQQRGMLSTSRRCLNWFATNFGDRYSFAAVSKDDVVFVVAKGNRGEELRKIAESWNGHVDDLELWG